MAETASFLLDLPLELRHVIFRLCIRDLRYTPESIRKIRGRASFFSPPLAQTNRQLREEISALFFSSRPVKVQVCEDIDSDATALLECLRQRYSYVEYIRQLEISHRVGFFHPYLTHKTIVGATSRFVVVRDDRGTRVDVTCDFNTAGNLADEIPDQADICSCALSARMARAESKFQNDQQHVVISTQGTLLNAVANFLRLMDLDHYRASPDSTGFADQNSTIWPNCQCCTGRCWFLCGPRLMISQQTPWIRWAGFWWLSCKTEADPIAVKSINKPWLLDYRETAAARGLRLRSLEELIKEWNI